MSGHSKWSKIKRQKGIEDQKRGAVFSKLAKAITVAAKQGKSGDVGKNASLRLLVDKAKAVNMPKANIQRAIERASGHDGGGMEEFNLEGYGPGGVAIIVKLVTDNRKRTTAEVKNLFERNGGNLGGPGSAKFMFVSEGGKLKPQSKIDLTSEDKGKFERLLKALQSHDDVDELAHTANI